MEFKVSIIKSHNFFIQLITLFIALLPLYLQGQSFPNPVTLSTGQGAIGSVDPLWLVSPWFNNNPPNPIGLNYGPALINNNCAPGSWVSPSALPSPINNGNWITGTEASCVDNTINGYRYFRLTLNLPSECNGNSITISGNYTLKLIGYVDNQITNVYVNGTPTGITGGNFNSGGQLNMSLTGPWVPGLNYVDILVFNAPGGQQNPYGLLVVANSSANSVADTDGDGVSDLIDLCPCQAGITANGCTPPISPDVTICKGDSTILNVSASGTYLWSNGSTNDSITVSPTQNSTYTVTVTGLNGSTSNLSVNVKVHPTYNIDLFDTICQGNQISFNGITLNQAGTYQESFQSINGCDSLVTLYLTVLAPKTSNNSKEACSSFMWNGTNYTTTGIYTFQTTTASGCDSVAVLNLTIHLPDQSTENYTVCDSFLWQLSNQIYYSSGSYSVVRPNVFGCLSTYELFLTVIETPTAPQLLSTLAECPGDPIKISATYNPSSSIQWFGPNNFVSNQSSFSILSNEQQLGTYFAYVLDGSCISDTNEINPAILNTKNLNDKLFPNVLTLNTDKINDILDLKSYFSSCSEYTLNIFNRWGIQVYEQIQGSEPFSGKAQDGTELKNGVYFYLLKHDQGQQSGYIHLLN